MEKYEILLCNTLHWNYEQNKLALFNLLNSTKKHFTSEQSFESKQFHRIYGWMYGESCSMKNIFEALSFESKHKCSKTLNKAFSAFIIVDCSKYKSVLFETLNWSWQVGNESKWKSLFACKAEFRVTARASLSPQKCSLIFSSSWAVRCEAGVFPCWLFTFN